MEKSGQMQEKASGALKKRVGKTIIHLASGFSQEIEVLVVMLSG